MTYPIGTTFGTVSYTGSRVVADGPDVGTEPDFEAYSGTVQITASIPSLSLSDREVTFGTQTYTLDSLGVMRNSQGLSAISQIACDIPGSNPIGWTYTARFFFDNGVVVPEKNFRVLTGQNVNLYSVQSVAESLGVNVTAGPAGANGRSILSITPHPSDVTQVVVTFTDATTQTLTLPAPLAGRGIADWRLTGGLVYLDFTDATSSSGIAIAVGPAGPTGAAGAAGAAGTNGTNGTNGTGGPGVAATAKNQNVKSSGAGFPTEFGRVRNCLVDRHGADPTGVVACDAAFAAFLTDAATYGTEIIPPGTFKLSAASRTVIPAGTHLRGSGEGVTTISIAHIEGGLSYGILGTVVGDLGAGGSMQAFTVDGTYVSRNPMRWLFTTGVKVDGLEILKGAFDAADPDNSAALILRRAQNYEIHNLRINNHRGHGVIMDFGAGGILWDRGRIGNCGNAGANVYHLWTRDTSSDVVDPYPQPSDITMRLVFIESANSGQDYLVRLDSMTQGRFTVQTNLGALGKATGTVFYLGDTSRLNFDGSAIAGKYSGDASGMKLMVCSANAKKTDLSGIRSELTNAGTGLDIDIAADVSFAVEPYWGTAGSAVTTQITGAGAHRVSRGFVQRYDEVTQPAASAQNRGTTVYRPGTGATPDQFLVSAKAAATYSYVDLLGVPPTVVATEPAVGTAKTIASGIDIWKGTLTAPSAAGVITPPAAVEGLLLVLRITHGGTGAAAARTYSIAGTTVGDPDSTALSGSVAVGKMNVVVLSCFTTGTWSVKTTSTGVPAA